VKLLRRRDINQPSPGPGDVDSRRPIPGVAHVSLAESAANSTYHSLQLSLERRLRGGFGVLSSYTFSKSIDDASAFLNTDGDQSFPQNSHDVAAERGLSAFDLRQRFVLAGTYALSSGRDAFTRNWQVHVITTLQSGRPFTPILSFDNSNTGNIGGTFGADRPNAVADPVLADPMPERYFRTEAFVAPEAFQFGNTGRNVLTGPGLANVDVALARAFSLGESARFSIRTEAFNLANHPNFDLPRRVAGQPDFGRVTSAASSRQIQLGLRLEF
jgi:hypothetical protein